ncbi:MAG TPA: ATP-binding protein [Candidatus Pacearchaeota archaeon]|nr:ATP-binding protein [Candidatus Pacearchaeota archaeon]
MDFEEFVVVASRALRHDLINALFVVQAHIDFLKDDISPEKFNVIMAQTEKVLSIMEVWKELEEFGESSSWQELKTLLLRVRTQMNAPHLEINTQDVKVNTNGLFQFVFRNLIDNSMRHGGKPDIDIVMSVSTRIEDSNLIIIYEDNGVGIPEEDKSRIFAQGFGKHTGLGMFFARQIIELMGGTIVENGAPGRGARFEIKLPKDAYRISNCDL